MSFAEKLKTKVNELRQKTLDVVELADDDLRDQRLSHCNSCEHLFNLTRNCKKCGCFVDTKTRMAKAKCPINKW